MANTLKVIVENENVLTQSVLNGIDTVNIIASNIKTYTATQDCFVYMAVFAAMTKAYIDGVEIAQHINGADHSEFNIILLKKGQTLTFSSTISTILTVFAIKR